MSHALFEGGAAQNVPNSLSSCWPVSSSSSASRRTFARPHKAMPKASKASAISAAGCARGHERVSLLAPFGLRDVVRDPLIRIRTELGTAGEQSGEDCTASHQRSGARA